MILSTKYGIALFTDGSAYHEDRTGGWAWVAVDANGGTETKAGSALDTTISRMELTAAVEGLEYLHNEYGLLDVLVYSDSEHLVLGCNDKSRKRIKNRDCWAELDEMIGRHRLVEFEHVRGHQDNTYNNLADKLAGEARRSKGNV